MNVFAKSLLAAACGMAFLTSAASAAQVNGPICQASVSGGVAAPATHGDPSFQLYPEDVRNAIVDIELSSCGENPGFGDACTVDGAKFLSVIQMFGTCGDLSGLGTFAFNTNDDGSYDCAPGTGFNEDTGDCFRDEFDECIPCAPVCFGRISCGTVSVGVAGVGRNALPAVQCDMKLTHDENGVRRASSARGIRAELLLDGELAAGDRSAGAEACPADEAWQLESSGLLLGGDVDESCF